MPKPVCVTCRREMRAVNTGITVATMYLVDPVTNKKEPSALHEGDLWECPSCQHQVILGISPMGYVEYYDEFFLKSLARAKASGELYIAYE